ncbi:MAG: putative zinc-binding metallopeptidase [Planctomycetales bacterium]|nr:putative zinc-binding metallopeptidase [Planctomycetales bacterium]
MTSRTAQRRQRRRLTNLSDEQLLDYRFCDLPVAIEGTALEQRIDQLHEELAARGLNFAPHCWLSEEWFSPDGVPGVAIPFYLAHPRLMRLERSQMLEVEGGTRDSCMKILRHEAGHAIDTAYRLRRKRSYREHFGRVSQPYPEFYRPRPYSRSFVQNLDMWYAQSHPLEDFAETFAVWLKPRSRWRTQYRGWPAIKKLHYVDELMEEISERAPLVNSTRRVDPLSRLRKTLRQHYEEKRQHYGLEHPDFYDGNLKRLFSSSAEHRTNVSAAVFLNRLRPELRQAVAHWTGEYRYTIDQILTEMIDRCRELKLRLATSEEEARRDALVMVTVETMNHLHGGHHRIAL